MKDIYPNTVKVVTIIGHANRMRVRSNPEWPAKEPLVEIEAELSKLSDDDLEVIGDGDQDEAEELANAKGANWELINKFFNEVFDGDYIDTFYIR